MNRADLTASFDDFLTSLFDAIEPVLTEPGQRRVYTEARKSIGGLSPELPAEIHSLPVCASLDDAMRAEMPTRELRNVVAAFGRLAPLLSWYDRPDSTGTGSAGFPDGHGNAFIVGPQGLAHHPDLWIGASLLAPDVRYPDHTHPPEELYLVLSDGEFRNAQTDWVRPGPGGLFHNPPGIVHAMRSGETPLLAIWTLVPAA